MCAGMYKLLLRYFDNNNKRDYMCDDARYAGGESGGPGPIELPEFD